MRRFPRAWFWRRYLRAICRRCASPRWIRWKRCGRNEPGSVQTEIHFDGGQDRNWEAILGAWLELPLAHCGDGVLIETQAKTFRHLKVARDAVRANLDREVHGALISRN